MGLPEDLEAVREALISWYEDDHRAFPWRRTDDPYAILVSEVMSQQTQLGRVVEAWEEFVERWPTTAELAAADRADVVGFWTDHSLGYNNRAKYLHEAAAQIETTYDGEFPETPAELEELMGVGPYTANAVASFAFNAGDAVVDTNVKRVCHRAFDVPDDDTAFEEAATTCSRRAGRGSGTTRSWNSAASPADRHLAVTRPVVPGVSGVAPTRAATLPRRTFPRSRVSRVVAASFGAA